MSAHRRAFPDVVARAQRKTKVVEKIFTNGLDDIARHESRRYSSSIAGRQARLVRAGKSKTNLNF